MASKSLDSVTKKTETPFYFILLLTNLLPLVCLSQHT